MIKNETRKKLVDIIVAEYKKKREAENFPESSLERIKSEIRVISKSESLILDLISFLKEKKKAGTKNEVNSLVFYVMGITNKMPDLEREFNFTFDLDEANRRKSPPDIDIDFEYREAILEHLTEIYGKDNVALIGTAISMKPKAAVQFAAKALNIMGSYYEPNDRKFSSENDREAKRISKIMMNNNFTLPQWLGEDEEMKVTNVKIRTAMARLKEEYDKYPKVFEVAKKLEGLLKSYGTHAAGVVISEREITKDIPLFSIKDHTGEMGEYEKQFMSTQYDMDECEQLGLLKFDFLQLNNLRQMTMIENLIRERHGELNFDIEKLDPKDKKVFKTIDDLKLEGLFQISGPAFVSHNLRWNKKEGTYARDRAGNLIVDHKKGLIEVMGCNDFKDLVAANALGRPGPLNLKMHEDYKIGKADSANVTYEHELLEPILKDSYGQMIYQEQLIKMAQELAGFTFAEADGLRKACAKKKTSLLAEIEPKFRAGCKKNNIPQSVVDHMWQIAVEFGEYAFNKAHSTAYGFITYQMAYLKTYYPTEFICSILTSSSQKSDEALEISIAKFMVEYPDLKILPINVNKSRSYYFPEEDFVVRAPFDSIKGVGKRVAEDIEKKQPFVSIQDFMSRVDTDSRTLNNLIEIDAFKDYGDKEFVTYEIRKYEKMMEVAIKGGKKTSNIDVKSIW